MKPEPVARIMSKLTQLKISRVGIVDDDYDPPRASYELNEMIQRVVFSDDVTDDLARKCEMTREELESIGHFDEELVQRLWKIASDERGPTADVLRTQVFSARLDALAPLWALKQTLEDAGSQVEAFAPGSLERGVSAQLWFFDLMWKTSSAEDDVWKLSAEKVREQYSSETNSEAPPILVLMSFDENRLHKLEEAFRRYARVPVGYFLTLSKATLLEDNAPAALAAWLEDAVEHKKLEFRRSVHALTRAIRSAAKDALDRYDAALSNLAAEDYSHIYQNGVGHDGAALGSYMLWLFEPLFEHYIKQSRDVQRFQTDLDSLPEDRIPRFDLVSHEPSEALSEIFAARMWIRDARQIGEHLQQGDLVCNQTSDSRIVFMVMNADCDMVVSSSRSMKKISIILLEGKIEKTPQGIRTTEYFHSEDGTSYAPRYISWDIDNVLAVPHQQVRMNYQKVGWRLRRPYLTEIVQVWSQRVARVGTPVAPTAMEQATGLLLSWRTKGEWQAVTLDPARWKCLTFARRARSGERLVVFRGADQLEQEIVGRSAFKVVGGQLKNSDLRKSIEHFQELNRSERLVVKSDGRCTIKGDLEIRVARFDHSPETTARMILWVQIEGVDI